MFAYIPSFQIWMFHGNDAIKIYSQNIFIRSTVNCIFLLNWKNEKIGPIRTEYKALKCEVSHLRSHKHLKAQQQRESRMSLRNLWEANCMEDVLSIPVG